MRASQLRAGVPEQSQERRVLRLGLALGQALVELAEQVGRASLAAGQRTEESPKTMATWPLS